LAGDREDESGGVGAGDDDERKVEDDLAAVLGEQRSEDGYAEGAAGLPGGVQDAGGEADAVLRGAPDGHCGHRRHDEGGGAERKARADEQPQRFTIVASRVIMRNPRQIADSPSAEFRRRGSWDGPSRTGRVAREVMASIIPR
jgi:hypothetical protein